jgi:uncharacterized repeat protein (TIGR02543 family)
MLFLVAFLGMLLCAGLFTGCDDMKDFFHPDDSSSECVVTFNLQGGNINGATTTRKVSVKSGGSVGSAMPSNPTMTGYTFDGWWTATNGYGEQFTAYTTVNANITVYAYWMQASATTRTVTFNLQGGNINSATANQTRTVDYGSWLGDSMPLSPSRDGYTFNGWWTTTNGGGEQFTSYTIVYTNTTVYAYWMQASATTRTVTFDLQGGNINSATANQTRTVDYASWLGDNMPTNPSRDGYTFNGWWTATNGYGEQFTSYTTVYTNTTVYAYWTPDTQSPEGVSNITYSSVSGGVWTLQPDGSRKSPAISDYYGVTKARISFNSTTNASITIQLTVSSEAGYDYAFISQLDNASTTSASGYYTGSRISGEDSVTVTIPIPNAGDHFIDIGYQKDTGDSGGFDCAWFTVIDSVSTPPSHTVQINLRPVLDDPVLSNVSLSVNGTAHFFVDSEYASWVWYWDGEPISGATSSAYTIEANTRTPGVYELSVVVTTSTGKTLSARCRIVIYTN